MICDTLILNLLKNEIIPELISLDRNSSEYDIYLQLGLLMQSGMP